MRNQIVLFLCQPHINTNENLLYEWLLKGGAQSNYEAVFMEYTSVETEQDDFIDITRKPTVFPKEKITRNTQLRIIAHGTYESQNFFFDANGNPVISPDGLAEYLKASIDPEWIDTATNPLIIDLITCFGAYSPNDNTPSLAGNLLIALDRLQIHAKIIARESSMRLSNLLPNFLLKGIEMLNKEAHESLLKCRNECKSISRFNIFSALRLAYQEVNLLYDNELRITENYFIELINGETKSFRKTKIDNDSQTQKEKSLKEKAVGIIAHHFRRSLEREGAVNEFDQVLWDILNNFYYLIPRDLIKDIAEIDDNAPDIADKIKNLVLYYQSYMAQDRSNIQTGFWSRKQPLVFFEEMTSAIKEIFALLDPKPIRVEEWDDADVSLKVSTCASR